MTCNGVAGNPFWQELITRLVQARLPHALLLVGGELSEKRAFALFLAQWLLCETHNACLSCNACQWIQNLSHPDMLLLPDKTGESIKIDDVRLVSQHLAHAAHQGKYKIIIFSPAEAMPFAAMNALLKTLEEPPARSLLILISQYANLLPATLRSRCQRLVFPYAANTTSPLLPELEQTLQQLRDGRITVTKGAAQWQKEALADVVEALYYFAVKHIQQGVRQSQFMAPWFSWYDTINQAREQLACKFNPNHLLTIENLFYQWTQINAG